MSDKATPAFIQQLIARMGKSGDAAGILTLFAHMAELEARLTAERSGKLDLIGTAADAPGTSTLFARLAQIAGYTDTVESTLANLSTSAQAAAIIAYVDELETRLTAARAGYLDAAISSRAGNVSVQRGITAGAGNVTISVVNISKTIVLSKSKGSAGYVAARGSISLSPSGGTPLGGGEFGTTSGSFPTYSGSLTGGTTDLTTKEYSARLVDSTTIYCDGPVEWEVMSFA